MTDRFAADASAVGYFYQARFGLLLLLREGRANGDLRLTVEGLDDVSFDVDGDPVQLIQTKHHVTRHAALTNKSDDLWKTLRIWAERVSGGEIDPNSVLLVLLTTATAPEESAAAFLRSRETGDRDVEKAHELLLEAAISSKSRTLAEAFVSFRDLGREHQRMLLSAVRVLDSAPNIVDVGTEIQNDLDLFVRPEHKSAFAERVEGWWFREVIEALAGAGERSTSYVDLRSFISELRDRFTKEDLPADFPDPIKMSEGELPEEQRIFIEQLRLVATSEARIRQAISDYWRAFQQRSRWVEDGLLFDHDLERYESVLVDEWQRYFDRIQHDLEDGADEDEVRRAGYRLFDRVDTEVVRPIRPSFREIHVQRGTFHHLANDLKVGWHPDFVGNLQEIVDQARRKAS